jgi:predicted metal-dependent hydrolase
MIRLFRREAPTSGDSLVIRHSGETFSVALKRTKGARRYTLRVRTATHDVVLSMPARGSLASAREFAERHAAWIGARLRRLPSLVPFAPGEVVPLRGVEHVIAHRPDGRGVVWAEPAVGIDRRPRLCVAGEAHFASRRICDFLKREARRDLDAAVKRYTAALGKPARRVTVRDTTSRWGSCSASGALSFSWRLIFAPPFVLDYLAAHEVAHLAVMNHSAAFWALARRLDPETDRAEVWLKAHGASLHRYGPRQDRTNVK